jgi:hypothetical protein
MAMFVVCAVAVPFLLMGLMLAMERVEQPLRVDQIGDDLVHFFETARPDEVETFVREGYGPALTRYWRRRRIASRLAPTRLASTRLTSRS